MPSTDQSEIPNFEESALSTMPGRPKTVYVAVVWLKDRHQSHRTVLEAVRAHAGVYAAHFSQDKPALMIVDYDRAQTKALEILMTARSAGVQAWLVGC